MDKSVKKYLNDNHLTTVVEDKNFGHCYICKGYCLIGFIFCPWCGREYVDITKKSPPIIEGGE